ncbi:MAG: alpha/beta hydrolase [Bdellovibrionales bacterium]|mgnify:CR=1 FL=1|jgi:pimeloyl-ACP methyl ester carboxylesterase|nr:alpha/beta hydrolase [Bdellovibrionales bacterium]
MICFSPANGFPPESYKQLFNQIDDSIVCPKVIPYTEYFSLKDQGQTWIDYSDRLIQEIQELDRPIIGVGHSMGAILLLRASCYLPHLFKKLVLIDPTFLPLWAIASLRLSPKAFSRKFIPIISKTYRRKDLWSSKDEAYQDLRNKKLFRKFSEQSFQNYLSAALISNSDGNQTLRFSKQWEEHCFSTVINPWKWLKQSNIPTLGIIGENSNVITDRIYKKWKAVGTKSKIKIIPNATHLVPLEMPFETSLLINDFINN